MKYFYFLSIVCFLVLGGGCKSQENLITIDSTYTHPQSPYEAKVTAELTKNSDTTEANLKNIIVRQIDNRYNCKEQRVVLKKKHKLHKKGEAYSYIRAEDYDCFSPTNVDWDMVTFRSSHDRQDWSGGGRKRQIAEFWLTEYLRNLYIDFPRLRGSGTR